MDQVGAIRELAMTTKELCDALRHTHPSRTMCNEAADVIERQAATISELKVTEDKRIAEQDDEIERLERRINELLEFCEILRRERDAARSAK